MKKLFKVRVYSSWDNLCDKLTNLFNGKSKYIYLKTNYGRIIFFHSEDDGSPNKNMLKLFSSLRDQGKVDKYLCCDPDKISGTIRKYHIFNDIHGVINTEPEMSYSISQNVQLLVLSGDV